MLMLKSLVSVRELVLSTTLGFMESTERLGFGLKLKLLREMIIGKYKLLHTIKIRIWFKVKVIKRNDYW